MKIMSWQLFIENYTMHVFFFFLWMSRKKEKTNMSRTLAITKNSSMLYLLTLQYCHMAVKKYKIVLVIIRTNHNSFIIHFFHSFVLHIQKAQSPNGIVDYFICFLFYFTDYHPFVGYLKTKTYFGL